MASASPWGIHSQLGRSVRRLQYPDGRQCYQLDHERGPLIATLPPLYSDTSQPMTLPPNTAYFTSPLLMGSQHPWQAPGGTQYSSPTKTANSTRPPLTESRNPTPKPEGTPKFGELRSFPRDLPPFPGQPDEESPRSAMKVPSHVQSRTPDRRHGNFGPMSRDMVSTFSSALAPATKSIGTRTDGLECALNQLEELTTDDEAAGSPNYSIQETSAEVYVWSLATESWITTDVKLDTGASSNFVTADFVRRHVKLKPRVHPGGEIYDCKSVKGKQPIIGYVTLLFTASQNKDDPKYHRHVNFDVIETSHSPFGNLLLGIDFLLETKVVTMDKTALLNVKEKTLLWLVKEPAKANRNETERRESERQRLLSARQQAEQTPRASEQQRLAYAQRQAERLQPDFERQNRARARQQAQSVTTEAVQRPSRPEEHVAPSNKQSRKKESSSSMTLNMNGMTLDFNGMTLDMNDITSDMNGITWDSKA